MRHEQARLQHLDDEYQGDEGEGEEAGQGGDDQGEDYGQGGDYDQSDGGGELGGSTYYAICQTGHEWAGQNRSSYDEAQADADHHNANSHHGQPEAVVYTAS